MKRLFLSSAASRPPSSCRTTPSFPGLSLSIAPCVHAGQGCANPPGRMLPQSATRGRSDPPSPLQEPQPGDPQSPAPLPAGDLGLTRGARPVAASTRASKKAPAAIGGAMPPPGRQGILDQPTLFVDVDNSMTIAQEEIFSPGPGRSSRTTTRRHDADRQ